MSREPYAAKKEAYQRKDDIKKERLIYLSEDLADQVDSLTLAIHGNQSPVIISGIIFKCEHILDQINILK